VVKGMQTGTLIFNLTLYVNVIGSIYTVNVR